MTTNKADITHNLSQKLEISTKESLRVLDLFINIIKNNYKSKKVKVSGFGTFASKTTTKRIGRNPKTKESYIIKSRKKISFRASNKIKASIN